MNLANKILQLSLFGQEGKCDKECLIKIMQVSILSLIMITYFIFQAIVSFLFKDSLIVTCVSIASILVIAAYLGIFIKTKVVNAYSSISVMFIALALMAIILFGNISIYGTLFLGIFPILSITILGNKGAYYSIVFGLISFALFFINVEGYNTTNQPLSFKIFYLFSYFAALLLAFFMEAFKNRFYQAAEKELLDQKNENRIKDEFIAKLSHQIRTPLNNVLVISNILTNSNLDEKQRDMVETIQASTNNLVNVVNSMVSVSKIDSQRTGELNINFNLSTTLSNTIKLFSTQSLNNVSFSLKIDDSIPKNLNGDPIKIKQIFLNIIETIIKNKSSNKVSIELKVGRSKETDEFVELYFEVRCNRPIMLPLNESHSQFIINETTLTSASSQIYVELLDLAITQRLIESNSGRLSINLSSENATFTFSYVLKRSTNDIEEPSVDKESPVKIKSISESDASRLKPSIELENSNVLLVEDNLINQKIVILSLKKLVKNIEIANNGKEALDKFGTSKYDIILMDIQMPIMNGIVTTKKIREIEASTNSHTPVIAITANALLGDKEECISAGMDDYISKPFQIEVLIQKMRSLLRA